MMRLLPLVVVCVVLSACSSPTSPSMGQFQNAPAVQASPVTVTAILGGNVTVDVEDLIQVDLPADGAPWHGSWDATKLRLVSSTATRWTFEAEASTAPFSTLIALTDDFQWRNAVDTPMRRYYLVTIR